MRTRQWAMPLGLIFAMAMTVYGCTWLRSQPDSTVHPYMTTDDIQYYPAGPEFKLPREATAAKTEREKVEPKGFR